MLPWETFGVLGATPSNKGTVLSACRYTTRIAENPIHTARGLTDVRLVLVSLGDVPVVCSSRLALRCLQAGENKRSCAHMGVEAQRARLWAKCLLAELLAFGQ